ncbi:MAG: hypothetical protein WCX73_05540 [Candidatus Pacearchaeota archaeon]
MTIIQDVKPTGTDSAYVERPFDEAKAELESNGYHIVSLEEFAKVRIAQGKDSHVADYGAYVKEGFLYVPQKGIFLVRNSPILANAKEATECHKKGKEFYLTDTQVEEALTNSVQFKDSKSIPTNRFAEDERTAFAFGETAKVYGEFLKEAGIKEMPVYLASLENKSFARQAWLRELGDDYRSGLSGGGLYYSYAVRGVREIGLNNSENYTPEKISLVLKNLGFSGLEKNLLKELRK